jgi:hypothetical protein
MYIPISWKYFFVSIDYLYLYTYVLTHVLQLIFVVPNLDSHRVPLAEIYLTDNKSCLFDVLIAVVVNSSISLDVTPCIPLKVNRRFGRTYPSSGSNEAKQKPTWKQPECPCHLISSYFLAWLILRPWRWRRHIPPKRRLTLNDYIMLYPRRETSDICIIL